MTLESTINENRYIGNGSAKTFNFTFKVWKKSEVAVWTGDGVTEQNVSSSVSVAITSSGGSVTFQSAPETGTVIVIKRNMPYIQEDDYRNGSRFDAENIEDRLDQDCAERQDLKLEIGRCVRLPVTSSMTPEEFVQALLLGLQALEEAGEVSNATLIKALNSLTWRTLAARFADFVVVKDFGAKGDGTTNDSAAWALWRSQLRARGMGYAPSGQYKLSLVAQAVDIDSVASPSSSSDDDDVQRIIDAVTADTALEVLPLTEGCLTNGAAMLGVIEPNNLLLKNNIIAFGRNNEVSGSNADDLAPMICLTSKTDVTDSTVSGTPYKTTLFYGNVTQRSDGYFDGGSYSKTNTLLTNGMIVVGEQAGAGNNDLSCIAGKARKYNIPGGVGDACGTGGSAVCFSRQKGMTAAGEYVIRIGKVSDSETTVDASAANNAGRIGTTCPADFGNVCTSKWQVALHTNSQADAGQSPATAHVYMNGGTKAVSAWNGIVMAYNLFKGPANSAVFKNCIPDATTGEPQTSDGQVIERYAGTVVYTDEDGHLDGTVAINMGSFSQTKGYPETCLKLGYAKWHVWTPSSELKMRSLGIDCGAIGNVWHKLNAQETNAGTHGSTAIVFQEDGTTQGYVQYDGGVLTIANKNISSAADAVAVVLTGNQLRPSAASDDISLGSDSYRFAQLYIEAGSVSTSDERVKQDIDEIPEAVFRAWDRVQYRQYRFINAVEKKGSNARAHIGLIAQRVKEAFEAEGLDAFKYGLLCYDEWEYSPEKWNEWDETIPAEYFENGTVAVEERVVHHRELVSEEVQAGSIYSIRYEEALALECAYQRWRLEQIEARLAALEVQ